MNMNSTPRSLLRALWPLLLAVQAVSSSAATPPVVDPAPPPPAAAPAAAPAGGTGAATAASIPSGDPAAGTRALDEQIQGLKKDVVDLNKDLFVLEEELLFPANTQVAVFVSMDVGDFLDRKSVV